MLSLSVFNVMAMFTFFSFGISGSFSSRFFGLPLDLDTTTTAPSLVVGELGGVWVRAEDEDPLRRPGLPPGTGSASLDISENNKSPVIRTPQAL